MLDRLLFSQMVVVYATVVMLLLFEFAPLLEMASVSFKSSKDVYLRPGEATAHWPNISAFGRILQNTPSFWRDIANSFFISAGSAALTVCLALGPAWGLARSRRISANLALALLVGAYMLASSLMLAPQYKLMERLGLLNSYWALIAPNVALMAPVTIWALRRVFCALPAEFELTARLEGFTKPQILRLVVAPLAWRGLLAVSAVVFILTYTQNLIFACVMNKDSQLYTHPVRAMELAENQNLEWNEVMAGCLVGILPFLFIGSLIYLYINGAYLRKKGLS